MTRVCDLNDFVMRECEVVDTHIHGLSGCSSNQILDVGYGDGRMVAYFLSKGFTVRAVISIAPAKLNCGKTSELQTSLMTICSVNVLT